LLSTENVKTFHLYTGSKKRAKPTVQQEETPQPPPEKPPEEIEGDMLLPEPEVQQKEEIIFFVSCDEQFGHLVSFSSQLIF